MSLLSSKLRRRSGCAAGLCFFFRFGAGSSLKRPGLARVRSCRRPASGVGRGTGEGKWRMRAPPGTPAGCRGSYSHLCGQPAPFAGYIHPVAAANFSSAHARAHVPRHPRTYAPRRAVHCSPSWLNRSALMTVSAMLWAAMRASRWASRSCLNLRFKDSSRFCEAKDEMVAGRMWDSGRTRKGAGEMNGERGRGGRDARKGMCSDKEDDAEVRGWRNTEERNRLWGGRIQRKGTGGHT